MAKIKRTTRATVELNKVLAEGGVQLRLFEDDKDADIIEVHVTVDGIAADLDGMIAAAEMRRADGTRVECEGTVSGGVVTIELNEHCYVLPGEMTLSIRIGNGTSNSLTLLVIHGEVIERGDGAMVDIDETLVDIEDIIELYAGMTKALEETVEATENAKEAANAVASMTATATSVPSTEAANVWKGTNENGGIQLSFAIPRGERGTMIYNGDKITGKSTTPKAFETGIARALKGDLYANVGMGDDAGNIYECTEGGNAATALWKYKTNWRGATGAVEGIDYYDGEPMPLGTASPGTAQGLTARGDHAHPMPSAADVGALGIDAMKENLLINRDFEVNQRGVSIFQGSVEMAKNASDGWLFYGTGATFTVPGNGEKNAGVYISNDGTTTCGVVQRLRSDAIQPGKTYTIVCKANFDVSAMLTYGANASGNTKSVDLSKTDGGIYAFSFVAEESSDGYHNVRFRTMAIEQNAQLDWMDLYEGECTAHNCPPHVRQPFHDALAECRMRYQMLKEQGTTMVLAGFISSSGTALYFTLPCQPMQSSTPTVEGFNLVGSVRTAQGYLITQQLLGEIELYGAYSKYANFCTCRIMLATPLPDYNNTTVSIELRTNGEIAMYDEL